MLKSFKSRTDQAEERICKFKNGLVKLSSQSSENINEINEKIVIYGIQTKNICVGESKWNVCYKTSWKQKSPKDHHKQLNTNKMNKQGEVDIFL